MLIQDFLNTHAANIWGPNVDQTEKHLTESVSKINVFLSFDNNNTKHLSDIRARDIMDFGHWYRRTTGRSESTLNHYKAAISKLFSYAEEYGEIEADQVPRIKFNKIKQPAPHFYSPEEISKIQDYLVGCKKSWLLHMFNIGICTGMRKSEIWGVTRDNIKWIDGEMFIHLEHTKNGYERDVPVSLEVKLAFDAVDWSFPKTRSGKFPEGPHRRAWNEIRRVICKGKKMANFHAARHTAASTLSNEMSTNLGLVAELLGHRDMSTTKKYVHAKPETMAGLVARLSSISVKQVNLDLE